MNDRVESAFLGHGEEDSNTSSNPTFDSVVQARL